ncbi:tail fiber protein [Fulvivirgaceae bacterium BMA12]|uniref:Tail fiber protein n=1 Tax=Agaribacillus aureus TaxID=3051825 RepID=A0ABT8L2U2_9BACT|nr:tail fiber protein [Fulvivirgaceae bacterium BMA12]
MKKYCIIIPIIFLMCSSVWAQNYVENITIKKGSASGRAQVFLNDENTDLVWRFGLTGAGANNFNFFDGSTNIISLKYGGDIIFQPTGFVGIGTNNPRGNLELSNGNRNLLFDFVGVTGHRILADGSNGGSLQLQFNAVDVASSVFAIDEQLSSDINDTQRRFTIHKGGNVAIGGNPDSNAKLTVAGKIHSQEVKVTVGAGSDFVFKEDYKLMPLRKLETYIRENKHLPDIASEKEMLEKGLELGAFQMKLLQKVEELTLYVIELEKENKRQQKEIESLKAR